jgi:hypothetical protein
MKEKTVMLALSLVAGILVLVTGCGGKGPRPVHVSGTVAIDGKPLAGGFIRLVPDGARPSSGTISPDGRFTLGCLKADDGCVTGVHKVEIQGFKQLSDTRCQWLAPRKYSNVCTSGLSVTIDGPTDTLQINLTWAGSPEKGPFTETLLDDPHGPRRPGKR